MSIKRTGLVGYSEVGKIFSAGLKDKPGVAAMAVWDAKLANPATQASRTGPCGHGRREGPAILAGAVRYE